MQAIRLVGTKDMEHDEWLEWRSVPGFEGLYKVSKTGEVLSLTRNGTKGGLLKKHIDRYGYEKVVLRKQNKPYYFTVHRLVALAFIACEESKNQVNHINGKRTDNRVENLEWVTCKENIYHSHTLGNQKTVMKPINAIHIDTGKTSCFPSQRESERTLGISQGNITRVLNGTFSQCNGYYFEFLKEDKK